jgi:hypothetical protein
MDGCSQRSAPRLRTSAPLNLRTGIFFLPPILHLLSFLSLMLYIRWKVFAHKYDCLTLNHGILIDQCSVCTFHFMPSGQETQTRLVDGKESHAAAAFGPTSTSRPTLLSSLCNAQSIPSPTQSSNPTQID